MPAPLAVDREAVRVLAVAVGVREAARQMGIAEKTVLRWSHTEGWFAKAPVTVLPPTMQPRTVGTVKPADAMANVLSDRHKRSKVNLSKYVLRASAKAATLPSSQLLAQAQDVKAVALTAAQVWPEQKAGQDIRIALFSGASLPPDGPVLDISATVERQSE